MNIEETARENNFRNGRVRMPHEFSHEMGADGTGFSRLDKYDLELADSELPKFVKIKRKKPKPK